VVVLQPADAAAGLDGHLGGLGRFRLHGDLEVAVEVEAGAFHTVG